MADNVKGPGMLWVTGAIAKSPTNPLTEETFLRWYDDDHIPEIIATSGIKNAFRCLHVDKTSPLGTPECPRPYLAFYPMPEMAFTQGDEFKRIRVKSDILPGTGIVYDMADLDVGYYGFEGKMGGGGEKGPASYFVVSGIEPAEGTPDDDVLVFFNQETTTVSKAEHYQRSLRFRLLYARTNAQSRALKGLPTTDEPAPEPPTWMQVHVFSAEPTSNVRATVQSGEAAHAVLKQAKKSETDAYRIARVQGEGEFFED